MSSAPALLVYRSDDGRRHRRRKMALYCNNSILRWADPQYGVDVCHATLVLWHCIMFDPVTVAYRFFCCKSAHPGDFCWSTECDDLVRCERRGGFVDNVPVWLWLLNQLLLMCCCRLRPITPNQSSTSIAKYYRIFYMRLMKSFYIYGFACVNKLWNRPIALYFWNAAFYQVITRVYSIPRCANFGFHAAVDDNCRLHWQLLHRRLITRGRSRWAALAATEATIDSALIAAVRCSRIKTQSMWSHQSVNRNQISFSTHDSTQSSCRRKH